MVGIRTLVTILLAALAAAAGDESTSEASEPSKVKVAVNRAFRGRVVSIKKKRVTLYYDFEDREQLADFEDARPPRLLDASRNIVRIEGGRLVLEGSSAIRHKMEGQGEFRVQFYARLGDKRNVGTVFTEPVLSDFFVVLNLFDHRFYHDHALLLAACGLHEDEGADKDMAMVNWRDIFKTNLDNKVKVGEDLLIEVSKDGWTETCRVNDVEGKGSSKGKTRWMDAYQFGLWVHGSRMTVDDLTLVVIPTEEYLALNDLKAEIEKDWEEVPTTGVLAGVADVPPRLRAQIEEFARGAGDAAPVLAALDSKSLPKKAREVAAQVLAGRKDPKMVPKLIDGLYSEDALTRELSIGVIRQLTGKTFGYQPRASEAARSKAIRALNEFIRSDSARYYG